jgi:hypothetical protein
MYATASKYAARIGSSAFLRQSGATDSESGMSVKLHFPLHMSRTSSPLHHNVEDVPF